MSKTTSGKSSNSADVGGAGGESSKGLSAGVGGAEDKSSKGPSAKAVGVFQEFFVEILGNLLPGLLVTVLGSMTLLWSLRQVCLAISAEDADGGEVVNIWHLVGQVNWGVWAFVLVLSYIIGCILYRLDVKRPDFVSARYILWHDDDAQSKGAVRYTSPPDESAEHKDPSRRPTWWDRLRHRALKLIPLPAGKCKYFDVYLEDARRRAEMILDVQFPYLFLKEYLQDRGLAHLAKHIPWSGAAGTSYVRRTKMFVNILKSRLHFVVPGGMREIVRHEAHVRLMSSVWYGARTLLVIALAGLLTGIIVPWCVESPDSSCTMRSVALATWSSVVLVIAVWIRWRIVRFFHYMRVREIISVLETASIVSEEYDIFKHLGEDQDGASATDETSPPDAQR